MAGRGFDPAALLERDADSDGKLSRDELPEQMLRRFDRIDANGDGFLDREELEAMPRGPRR